MLTNKDFFFCYNKELYLYLKKHGIESLLKAKHFKTDATFYMYEKSERLDAILDKRNKLKETTV